MILLCVIKLSSALSSCSSVTFLYSVFCPLVVITHLYELQLNHAPANVRRNCFACRVVRSWNSLPADTTDFGSLNLFRKSLHRTDFSSFLTVD